MESRKLIEVFSEEAASRLTGVSMRQLRYWDHSGFFSPSLADRDRRRPYSRLYSFRDIVALSVLNALRNDAKLPLHRLREVKDRLLSLGDASWAETTLYVDHENIILANPVTRTNEIASGQKVLQIPLRQASASMREEVERFNQRAPTDIGKFVRNRSIAHNQLVFAGTRIPVENVRAFAAEGYSIGQIKLEYPILTEEDIQAAIDHNLAA